MLSPASFREYLANATLETPPTSNNAVRSILYRSGSTSGSSSSSVTSCTTDPAPSIEVGEIAELPPSTDIMKTMECPVCKDIAFPPIWNCSSGHSICNTCRQQLVNCALCKANFSEARNYPLESLVLSSKFNCHYKSKGCTELIKGENYREHLRNCKSRPGAGQGCHKILPSGYTYRNRPPSSTGEDDLMADLESQFSGLDIEDDFEVVSWVKCQNGRYPENAIVAGYSDGEPVLISRAYQGSRLTIGRLIPSEKAAYVYWQTCRKKWYYEVLVAIPQTVKWVDASWGDVPLGAVNGGSSPDMANIFIGRACKDERYIPGFVQPACQGCFVGVGQQIHLSHDYQVLVRDI